MEMSRWTLVVEFDSIQEMIAEDDYEGGKSEAAEFYTFIRDYWSGMDETWLNEDTDMTDETVTVTFPTLDDIEQPPEVLDIGRRALRSALSAELQVFP